MRRCFFDPLPGWLFLLVASATAGCAAPRPIFPPVEPPIVFPSDGAPARFEYVGAIGGEADLGRPRSFWQWFTAIWAGAEEPASLLSAHGAAVADGDVLYVSDADSHLVHCFDLERREYRAISDAAPELPFVTPIGVTLAANRLLVADRALRLIALLSPEGEPLGAIGEDRLKGPAGIAVGPSGRVYVADVPAHDVKVFESDGAFVRVVGQRGEAAGEFNFPTHVACDAEENLYVSDSLNCRIQVFDREGRFVRTWGQRGDFPGDFSQPKGIACDRRGHVYVVDSHYENVQVFDPEGRLLLAFGEEGHDPGKFWLPIGIFADGQDRIWVCDAFNHRVQLFRYLGESALSDDSQDPEIRTKEIAP